MKESRGQIGKVCRWTNSGQNHKEAEAVIKKINKYSEMLDANQFILCQIFMWHP